MFLIMNALHVLGHEIIIKFWVWVKSAYNVPTDVPIELELAIIGATTTVLLVAE